MLAERLVRYNGFFLYIIIGIQLYNLIYAGVYTGGTFHSLSSRVYAGLYLSLILFSLAALAAVGRMKRDIAQKARRICQLQALYGFFLLLWAACVTLYDQRVSEGISVYLIVALTVAMTVYFKPLQALAAYGSVTTVLLWLIPAFQGVPSDGYGRNVNVSIMTLMAVFICAYRNASERRRYLDMQTILEQNRSLNEAARLDPLTRLRNRRFLDEEMDELYRRCGTEGLALTFMMLDIDHFKAYNDTYGHPQGDECLRRMAWRLSQELKPDREMLVRYGGEEFLYVGIGVDAEEAAETGERLCGCVRDLAIGPSEKDRRSVSISVGVSTGFPCREAKNGAWQSILLQADKALYQAKNTGRDRCVVASGHAAGTAEG